MGLKDITKIMVSKTTNKTTTTKKNNKYSGPRLSSFTIKSEGNRKWGEGAG